MFGGTIYFTSVYPDHCVVTTERMTVPPLSVYIGQSQLECSDSSEKTFCNTRTNFLEIVFAFCLSVAMHLLPEEHNDTDPYIMVMCDSCRVQLLSSFVQLSVEQENNELMTGDLLGQAV